LYYEAVLKEALRPPEGLVVAASLSPVGSESKLLIAKHGARYELLEGTPQGGGLRDQLRKLKLDSNLPSTPGEVARQITVGWKSIPLSAAEFDKLNRQIAAALVEYTSNLMLRSERRLPERTPVIVLHAPIYSVEYDNNFEHVEISVSDVGDKSDPVI